MTNKENTEEPVCVRCVRPRAAHGSPTSVATPHRRGHILCLEKAVQQSGLELRELRQLREENSKLKRRGHW